MGDKEDLPEALKGITPDRLRKAVDDVNKHREEEKRRFEELKKQAKPLEELLVSEIFRVNRIIVTQYDTSFIPTSEMVIGGKSIGFYITTYDNLGNNYTTFNGSISVP